MRRISLFAAALLLTLVSAAEAQMGRATGSVVDSSGNAIKGAVVKASNSQAYPPQITSTTDARGRWAMIGLRAGVWTFAAEAPGYIPTEGTVPIRQGTPGAPMRFVLQRTPEPIPGALSRNIDEELGAAQAMRADGRLDQALSAYQAIHSRNPKLTTLNLVIAGVYRQKAAQEADAAARTALYDRAIASYSEILRSDADNDRARLELGVTQNAAGNRDAASTTFREIIATRPGSPAAVEANALLQEIAK